MKGNGLRLIGDGFRLDFSKNFFIERVVKHGNRLLRAVVDLLVLEMFRRCVDGMLMDTVVMDLAALGLDLMTLNGFSSANGSMAACESS